MLVSATATPTATSTTTSRPMDRAHRALAHRSWVFETGLFFAILIIPSLGLTFRRTIELSPRASGPSVILQLVPEWHIWRRPT